MSKFMLFVVSCLLCSACVPNQKNAEVGGAPNTGSSAPPVSGGSSAPQPDPAALLAAHNQWRAKVGAPALQWSDTLAGTARQWAEQLAASGCEHKHSGQGGYGENLYFPSPVTWPSGRTEVQQVSPQHVVDRWGSESKNYNYASNSCSGVCSHYTQLVWRDSREVGCGTAVCADKSQIWVCNYAPAGNAGNQRPY